MGDGENYGRDQADGTRDHRQSRLFTSEDGSFDRERAHDESLPIEDGTVVDVDSLAEHQTYIDDRGIYDERNRLNDLTGREWKYATKSVIAESYPPAVQHDLRSEHGGQKPPRLCADLIERFSKSGETVLDPFAGVGGTLLGASFCEHEGTGKRDAIGFERNERWAAIYSEVLERENEDRQAVGNPPLAHQDMRCGDCATLIDDLTSNSIDLLLTDVPYWNMDELSQTRNRHETRASKLGAFDEKDDKTEGEGEHEEIAPVSKADWLQDMAGKFDRFRDVVVPGRYMIVFIGDMYRDNSYEFLSADLARAIDALPAVTLVATLIWYDPSKDLHVYGYPFSFVPSMVHQNILVFRVESQSDEV